MKLKKNPSNEKVKRLLKMFPKELHVSFPELKRVLKECYRADLAEYVVRLYRIFKLIDYYGPSDFSRVRIAEIRQEFPKVHKDIIKMFGVEKEGEEYAYRVLESYLKSAYQGPRYGFAHFLDPFEHYIQTAKLNDIYKILSYRLSYQHPSTIMNQWASFEYEALQSQRKVKKEALSWGKVVLDFKDESQWILLDQGYCDKEGKAAGHCGNANFKEGDRILSLRQPEKNDRWVVRATLVINEDVLVESKGFRNSKIKQEYHPYIEALLLKTDIVRLNLPSRYLTSVDFKLKDMTPEMRTRIFKKKPYLESFKAFRKKFGSKKLIDKIFQYAHGISFSGIDSETFSIEGDYLEVAEWRNVRDFAVRNRLHENFQWLLDHSPDDSTYDTPTTKDDVKYALGIIADKKPRFYKKILKICDELECSEPTDCAINELPELYEYIRQCVGDAWRAGTYSVWEKTILNILDKMVFESGAFVEHGFLEDPVKMKIELDDFYLWLAHDKGYDELTATLVEPLRKHDFEYEMDFDLKYFSIILIEGLSESLLKTDGYG